MSSESESLVSFAEKVLSCTASGRRALLKQYYCEKHPKYENSKVFQTQEDTPVTDASSATKVRKKGKENLFKAIYGNVVIIKRFSIC